MINKKGKLEAIKMKILYPMEDIKNVKLHLQTRKQVTSYKLGNVSIKRLYDQGLVSKIYRVLKT